MTPKVTDKSAPAPTPARWKGVLLWLVPALLALVFLAATTRERAARVRYVSGIADWSGGTSAAPASGSWTPRLVVAGHDNASYEWLDQVRQMFDRGEWRVRHIDYENAPQGRTVFAPSPYRWWLAGLTWIDHVASGKPVGACLEDTAMVADPLLLLLILVAASVWVARRFGAFAAVFLSLGLVTLFPFAAQFSPGAPEDPGLSWICAVASLLALVSGLGHAYDASPRRGAAARAFAAAGVLGGLGLWVDVPQQLPLLGGIALGALAAAWAGRSQKDAPAPPWRLWGLAGAATTFAAYLIENFPAHLGSWELRVVHPVMAVAWLGLGELLAAVTPSAGAPAKARRILGATLGLAAVAAIPLTLWYTKTWGFLEFELRSPRLAKLPDPVSATTFFDWVSHDGLSAAVWGTILPWVLVGPALWCLWRRQTSAGDRAAVALALGPVAVTTGFALSRISWWSGVDATLLVLAVATAAGLARGRLPALAAWTWSVAAALILLPGILQLLPADFGPNNALSQTEVVSLIERDLAHWLQSHTGREGGLVLATPNQTYTLYYYGGQRGLATLDWENREGLGAAVRILSASTPEESYELIQRRGVTHIIIPSWDSYLEVYAKLGLGQVEGSFMGRLKHWAIPPWLRPVAYLLPSIEGFSDQTVLVFEVVDDQDDAAAGSRLAEYFIDSGQLDLAEIQAQNLRRFPGDLGALVARAQVQVARNETEAFGRSVTTILGRIGAGGDRKLLWDRRVSLAIILAQSQHLDEARSQLEKCLSSADASNLRSLSTATLYHMHVLSRALGLEIKDPSLHQLSLDLLPADVRSRLAP